MNLSRRHKNWILLAANLALLVVLLLKHADATAAVGLPMSGWCLAVPFVAIAVLVTPERASFAGAVHALLFLATGMALGLTAGAWLESDEGLWLAEILWLPVGLVAAILHYSPSQRDHYQTGG